MCWLSGIGCCYGLLLLLARFGCSELRDPDACLQRRRSVLLEPCPVYRQVRVLERCAGDASVHIVVSVDSAPQDLAVIKGGVVVQWAWYPIDAK